MQLVNIQVVLYVIFNIGENKLYFHLFVNDSIQIVVNLIH